MDNQRTVGANFKSLQTIHIALCAGLALSLTAFRYVVKKEQTSAVDSQLIFDVIGVVTGFVCVLAARFLFFVRTKAALSVRTLKEKMDIFRAAFIVQMAVLEGAAMINAVFYFITKNDLHFFIALGILLLMAFRRPTRVIAAMLLFNNTEDRQQVYEDSTPL